MCALLVGLALALPTTSAHGELVDAIPAGQEELIADLLGKGAKLPGNCVWTGASIGRSLIESRYACAGQDVGVLVELRPGVPDALARTERFAFSVSRGAAPAGLVEGMAARFVAREGELRIMHVQPDERGPGEAQTPPSHRSFLIALGVAVVTLLAGATASTAIMRRSRRFVVAGEAGTHRLWAAEALALGIAYGVVLAAHRSILALAAAADAVLMRHGPAAAADQAAIAILYIVCATVAAALLGRLRAPLSARMTTVIVTVAYVVVGYAQSLPKEGLHFFGKLATPVPRSESVDTFPDRQHIAYRINALGFREPEWAIEKAPDVLRVVLIGDSYVFGIGVDTGDTLAARLEERFHQRSPDRRVEVLNLGIPGDNVTSHVDLYEEVLARAEPDVVVVCLTLPNDLSTWDVQTQQRDQSRIGALSIARFLLGRPATTFFDYVLLEQRVRPEGLAHLDAELTRLDRVRKASPSRPRTLLFAFGPVDAELVPLLTRNPEVPLIPSGEISSDDFIPGDGHPTVSGNRRFAAWIADAIGADDAYR